MKQDDFSFPEEPIAEIELNQCEFNYHYGSDGFLYSTNKFSGVLFVLIDGYWQDVQSVEFNMDAMQEESEVDSPFIFSEDFPTSNY